MPPAQVADNIVATLKNQAKVDATSVQQPSAAERSTPPSPSHSSRRVVSSLPSTVLGMLPLLLLLGVAATAAVLAPPKAEETLPAAVAGSAHPTTLIASSAVLLPTRAAKLAAVMEAVDAGDEAAVAQAAVMRSLNQLIERWDQNGRAPSEELILSFLMYDGSLELGTIVPHILVKASGDFLLNERILDSIRPHTLSLDPIYSIRVNTWWSASDGEMQCGPVALAASRHAERWVEKLLARLRVRRKLGLLTNEVAVAASTLSVGEGVPISEMVERLGRIFQLLLRGGCDVNVKAGGYTALHYIASALSKEEVDDTEKAKNYLPAAEMDALLAPLCRLLREHGARFDIPGDYASGDDGGVAYSSLRKYRGWTPTPTSDGYGLITPPHPSATPLDIFVARGWHACVDAVLHTEPKRPGGPVCERAVSPDRHRNRR